MQRNDYRRALILLRPLERGMSGHVRLERRTLNATMRFTVNGAESTCALNAVLLARDGDGYAAHPLGRLQTDSRGQAGMTASFDPRNVSGRDIDKYDLVCVVKSGKGAPELAMTGMVNGSKDVNWGKARAAATAPYVGRARNAALSDQDGARSRQTPSEPERSQRLAPRDADDASDERVPSALNENARVYQEPDTVDEPEPVAEPEPITQSEPVIEPDPVTQPEPAIELEPVIEPDPITQSEPAIELEPVIEPDPVTQSEPAIELEPVIEPDPVTQSEPAVELEPEPVIQTEPPAQSAQESSESETIVSTPGVTAGDLLGLDMSRAWPDAIESLRPLFQKLAAFEPFELDDFVFVEAPLPADDGAQGICAIGIRARDGAPVSVCYALPGVYSIDPPPGLEGYDYLGGWWYTVLSALTGDPEDDC